VIVDEIRNATEDNQYIEYVKRSINVESVLRVLVLRRKFMRFNKKLFPVQRPTLRTFVCCFIAFHFVAVNPNNLLSSGTANGTDVRVHCHFLPHVTIKQQFGFGISEPIALMTAPVFPPPQYPHPYPGVDAFTGEGTGIFSDV
jgi:hypothetical protein